MPRQSAAVYRRRRLLVIVLALVLVAAISGGVWLAIAQPWQAVSGDAAEKTPSATPTPTDEVTPSEGPSDGPSPDPTETPGVVACVAADIVVEAQTDADTYGSGEQPELSIKLTNKGGQDCTMNVGSATQKFTITSGSDTWWRSTDCQTEPSDLIVTLTAGKSVISATPVVWDRTRSSVDTCEDKNRPRAPGGGASYHVKVVIGGFESATSKQIILR